MTEVTKARWRVMSPYLWTTKCKPSGRKRLSVCLLVGYPVQCDVGNSKFQYSFQSYSKLQIANTRAPIKSVTLGGQVTHPHSLHSNYVDRLECLCPTAWQCIQYQQVQKEMQCCLIEWPN